MASLGHTQYRWIELIQLSDLAGAYGVSFVVMFVAASLARMFPIRVPRRTLPALQCGGHFGERSRLSGRSCRPPPCWPPRCSTDRLRIDANSTTAGPRIALIQGSIDVEMRYDPGRRDRIFEEYYDLSREAVEKNRDIDLIVWPETMFLEPLVTFDADAVRPPEFDGDDAEFHKQLREIAKQDKENTSPMARTAQSLGVPLLLGVDAHHFGADGVKCFNSAAYVGRDGRLLGRYDKMHLVMFGEYVPFAQYFPWLQQLTPLPISATAGERPVAFELDLPDRCASRNAGGLALGFASRRTSATRACCSHVIRGQVNALAAEGQEPDILVNLTNDGWFWGSSELDMHLICGVFRAVECRKPFLIAANTGFSAWIDSDGRIRAARPATRQGRHRGRAPPRSASPQLVSRPRRLVRGRVSGGVRVVRHGGVVRASPRRP